MSNDPTDPDYDPTDSPNVIPEQDEDQLAQDAGAYPGTGELLDDEQLVDEQGDESFPASDPPASY